MLQKIINAVTSACGSVPAVIIAVASLFVYGAAGIYFHFSDAYQLWANTIMSGISYLLLFAIQYTTNRDTKSINIKLDELILKYDKADNKVIDTELLDDKQMEDLHQKYVNAAMECRRFEEPEARS